jgi:hypothetical protein
MLTVVFQSVPVYLRHGVIVNYSIAIQELSHTVKVEGGSNVYSGLLKLPRENDIYHLSLTASTIVGPSPPELVSITMPAAGNVTRCVQFITLSFITICV